MQSLSELIKQMREIFQAVPEGIIISNPAGNITFVNKALLSYCGDPEKKWIHKQVSDFIVSKGLTNLSQATSKKKLFALAVQVLQEKKKKKVLKAFVMSLSNEKGYIGQLLNINIKTDAETSHPYGDKNNLILRILNANKYESWYISDVQKGYYLFFGDNLELLCGWTSKEILAGGLAMSFMLIHPLDRSRIINLLAEGLILRNKNKIIYDSIPISSRFRLLTKSNTWIWIEDSLSVLDRDEKGNVKFIIGSIKKTDPAFNDEKNSALKLLEENIRIIDGKTFVNVDALLKIQKNNIQNITNSTEVLRDSFQLTNRELEILNYILNGDSSEEITKKTHITKNTVNMHRKQIMKKMKAKNLADLVRKSMENGLLSKIS